MAAEPSTADAGIMIDSYHCPRCSRQLERSGAVVDPNRGPCGVFQCDDCVAEALMFGEPFSVAFTFLVDETGAAFEPADDSLI